jgi:hypothetical protein
MTVRLVWTATSGGSVIWITQAQSLGDGELANAAPAASDSVIDSNTANRLSVSPAATIPSADITNGELLQIRIVRNGPDEDNDTLQADAALALIRIDYTATR